MPHQEKQAADQAKEVIDLDFTNKFSELSYIAKRFILYFNINNQLNKNVQVIYQYYKLNVYCFFFFVFCFFFFVLFFFIFYT